VQAMPSLQTSGGCVQVPAWQTSFVQGFGSSAHGVPVCGAYVQPTAGLQSSVQALPSGGQAGSV